MMIKIFNNLSITVKGSIACLITGLLVFAASMFGIFELKNSSVTLDDISSSQLPSLLKIQESKTAVDDVNIALLGLVTLANMGVSEEVTNKRLEDLKAALEDSARYLSEYNTEFGVIGSDELLTEKLTEYTAKVQESIEFVLMDPTLAGIMVTQAEELYFGLRESLDAESEARISTTREISALGTQSAQESVTFVAVCAIASLFFGLILALIMLRTATKPLLAMTDVMRDLSDGRLDVTIANSDRKDEVGKMGRALEIFRQSALQTKQLEAEADNNRTAAEAERERLQRKAEEDAKSKLIEARRGLADGLKRMASGDLSFQLTEAFSEEFEPLRADLNDALSSLRETMERIITGSSTIEKSSDELRFGTDQLATRTEQQAAALQETSTTLEELTKTVTTTAGQATEASEKAQAAKNSSDESRKVVGDAVNAMEGIEKVSSEINKIINVIDDIAFQTNLLALNAGVEAARAGDAGRGFAVVAEEVRGLAHKSAGAAKEIQELIGRSANEISNGVNLVKKAGSSLDGIAVHVSEVHNRISSIASAANEQQMGIKEASTAIVSMDQMTQQNAAMVEESNAVTQLLASEIKTLTGRVGKFTIQSEHYRSYETSSKTAEIEAA